MKLKACMAGAMATVAVLCGSGPAGAADGPVLEGEAKRVIERVRAHYDALERVSLTVALKYTMPGDEADEAMEEQSAQFLMGRPNLFSLRITEEDGGYALVSDGRELTQFIGAPYNKFSRDPSPPNFTGLVAATSFGAPVEGMMWVVTPHLLPIALFDRGEFERFLSEVRTVKVEGREEVGGIAHDRVKVKGEGLAATLLVRAEGEPWVVRVESDLSHMFAELGEAGREAMERMPKITITFRDWNAAPKFDSETFAFTPPEGAERVPSLVEAVAGAMDREPAEQKLVLGAEAPAARLEMLEGGVFDLASHRGKEIVVVDFWATWCPPCVRGLPVVSRVTGEFKDKGVVFYAVNLEEDAETVRAFLKRRDLKIAVPMDEEGKMGEAFGVEGIPLTVIIDRDGTIQALHSGFHDEVEQLLRDELNELVAGRKLAPANPPKGP